MSRAAVREALSSCLAAVLTASSEDERRAAEQEMKALEVTEGRYWTTAHVRSCCVSVWQSMELCWLS